MGIRLIRRRSAVTTVAAVGVAASVAVTGLVGCSSGSAVDRSESVGRPSAEAAHVHEHQEQPPAAAKLTAVELRAQLEQLLGQHAFLAVRLTRSRLRGDEDLAQSADAALSKNTADLGELIGSVYGADAAEQFEQLWFRHVTYLFNYARGVADNDAAVKSEARRNLDEYTTALSTFVETATKKLIFEVVLNEDEGNFKFGKTTLPDEAKAKIDEMVSGLKADPKNVFIEIEGHTDNVGDRVVNEKIGLARAEAVERYLYEQYQVPLHKINVISYGEEKPVAPNNKRDGRAQNRRVVIKVLA